MSIDLSREFDLNRFYSVDEIKDISRKHEEPKSFEEYSGETFLVAFGKDGCAYWFISDGDNKWKVDHIWPS